MPEDDTIEKLGREIDLAAVMIEALSLALPLYPRADGRRWTQRNSPNPAPPRSATMTCAHLRV